MVLSSNCHRTKMTNKMTVVFISCVSVCLVAIVSLIVLPGYLPATKDAKKALVGTEFLLLSIAIDTFWWDNGKRLPQSWQQLENLYSYPELPIDPFHPDSEKYGAVFSSTRVIIWSVGPNPIDSLQIMPDKYLFEDELVLVCRKREDALDFKAYGLNAWHYHPFQPPAGCARPERQGTS